MKRLIIMCLMITCLVGCGQTNKDMEVDVVSGAAESISDNIENVKDTFKVLTVDWIENLNEKSLEVTKLNGENVSDLILYKIDTIKELEKINDSFKEQLNEYNNEFFENNTLLLMYATESSAGPTYELGNLIDNGNKLTIQINKIHPENGIGLTVISGKLFVLEIPDNIVNKYTEYEIGMLNVIEEN